MVIFSPMVKLFQVSYTSEPAAGGQWQSQTVPEPSGCYLRNRIWRGNCHTRFPVFLGIIRRKVRSTGSGTGLYFLDVEESVSIRGIKMEYSKAAGIDFLKSPGPKEIAEIAVGKCPGNQEAAIQAYEVFGRAAGDAIANAITLIDGLVVIGGGLSHSTVIPLKTGLKN